MDYLITLVSIPFSDMILKYYSFASFAEAFLQAFRWEWSVPMPIACAGSARSHNQLMKAVWPALCLTQLVARCGLEGIGSEIRTQFCFGPCQIHGAQKNLKFDRKGHL